MVDQWQHGSRFWREPRGYVVSARLNRTYPVAVRMKIGASMLRVGFIGLGAMSHEHVPGYLGNSDAEIRRGMLSR
jgi:hypothetical protein